ncbi:MAG TPA: CHAT domain-containing tetratricopeptide repeat protein [Pyrinomonadaceae bacterium]|nr:CHAT domain-containing tetratricopeptide repeat protein [Pyrinomonadaceae bacterium]
MNRTELASRLVAAEGEDERRALLSEHSALADVSLAHALKDICLEAWRSDPPRAVAASDALDLLARTDDSEETAAVRSWAAGVAALVAGQMTQAVAHLDDAAARFRSLCQPHTAAHTQVSTLIALAMLGRYDEAIETGLAAREVFLAHGDTLAAGKIEQNIGNLCGRRDRYEEARQYLRLAHERFLPTGDFRQLAMIENSLAFLYTLQHDFRSAERLYQQALDHAESSGLAVTLAEIESSMGNFALFQGRYDRALDMLERSRRRYAALGMPHQSAVAELELADAYLELNLAGEALAIYKRAIPTFAELGMRAEQARALAQAGRAALAAGDTAEAHRLLGEARSLYAAEGNTVGEAYVTLAEAQLHHAEGDHAQTAVLAAQAEAPLAREGTWRRMLLARWLRGEAARAQGHERLAQILLETTLRESEAQALPQIAERCHTSLGLLAAARGDAARAEESFKRAVSLIEDLRAPLPAEEFRTAFVADKLAPYDELVRLCLSEGGEARVREAFCYTERARSRALVEMMTGAVAARPRARDEFEAELLAQLEQLREELNWFYSRINRPPAGDDSARTSPEAMRALHDAARERETRVLEIMRQLQQRGGDGALGRTEPLDLNALQRALGGETALVEYTSLDGELLAFVVTGGGVEVVKSIARESDVAEALAQFRFQIGSLRYGSARMRSHLSRLDERARAHLARLYDMLLRPLEALTGDRRVVVVPHRALHYVPFHALHDGGAYAVERREFSYAPSAGVLRHCLARPEGRFGRAALFGVADEETPRVRDEIRALAPLFPSSVAFLDEEATLAALREHAPQADVLHLACHGQFRPDNPLFSSLKLGDGWLTVRDAYTLDFRGRLVTLSACETGVSGVAPGDELIGLVRGFFSAGAPTLILSLWTVDDEATADLMRDFYAHLLAGQRPAAALRSAQLNLMKERPHPFFWSPFVLLGRW